MPWCTNKSSVARKMLEILQVQTVKENEQTLKYTVILDKTLTKKIA